jgi:hypothetical protein
MTSPIETMSVSMRSLSRKSHSKSILVNFVVRKELVLKFGSKKKLEMLI